MFEKLISNITAAVSQPGFWWQLLVLALGFVLAWVANRLFSKFLDAQLGEDVAVGVREIGLRLTQRLLFPVSMLLFLVASIAVLELAQFPVFILSIALPLSIALAVTRSSVYILQRAFRPTPGLRAWEASISTFVWVLIALQLLGWLPEIKQALEELSVDVGQGKISMWSVITLFLAIAVFLVLSMALSNLVERKVRKAKYMSAGLREGVIKISKFVLILLGLVIALSSTGIDLTALTVFGGALGVGLGFGLQRIASNFISGFILVLDRSIRPGDVITVAGKGFGWVQELRARYVVVRDRDGVETLIPNENLITSEVVNWSYSDKKVRLKLPVQVSYDNDPELAMELLIKAADSVRRVLTEPIPVARLMGFGDNGLELQLRVWITDPQNGIGNVRSTINREIWRLFKENGIEIPYPQRVVRISSGDLP